MMHDLSLLGEAPLRTHGDHAWACVHVPSRLSTPPPLRRPPRCTFRPPSLQAQMGHIPLDEVRDRSKSSWGTMGIVSALLAGTFWADRFVGQWPALMLRWWYQCVTYLAVAGTNCARGGGGVLCQ